MKKAILIFLIIFIYLYLINIFIKFFIADSYYALSKSYTNKAEYTKAITSINSAIKNNPYEPAYHRESAKIRLARLQNIEVDSQEYKNYKNKIYEELLTARRLNKYNLATIRNSIPLYYFLTIRDLNKAGSENNIDENYFQITQDYYKELKDLYPNDLGLYVDIAKYEKKLNLVDDFENSINTIKNLRSDIINWNENLK